MGDAVWHFKVACAPRSAMCSDEDDDAPSIPTRARAGFEIRVVNKLPECVCCNAKQPDATKDDPCKDVLCCDCRCECIMLAQIYKQADANWSASHKQRRIIRPAALAADPQVECEKRREEAKKNAQGAGI